MGTAHPAPTARRTKRFRETIQVAKQNAPESAGAFCTTFAEIFLELVPQELVVHLVVELDLGDFHYGPQRARTAVRRAAFQIRVAGLDVSSEERRGPLRLLEVFQRRVNVVREVPLRRAQILDLGDLAVEAGLEDGIHDHVGVRVGSNGAHLRAHALLVAYGDTHHGAAVDRRSIELIGRLEVRVQPAVGVDAGIDQQADIVAMAENAIHELPTELAELLLALGIPEEVFAVLADRNVSVHPVAIDADHRLRQEARRETHVGGDLAADQLVKLNLVGGDNDFAVSIIDFELRWRDFRVIFLVLETHRSLDFSGGINERAQRIAGKRVIVAARIHVFEFSGFVVTPFRVLALEQESFDFIRGVERIALLLVETISVALQHSSNVGGVRRTVFVNYVPEHQDLSGPEDVCRRPVKRAPIHRQPQIAFALRRESANRRSVERQIVPALDQKLLVVIEHVQAAFEIAEQDGHRLDALFIRQILEAFFLNLVLGNSFLTLLFGSQIQLLQLIIGKGKKISQFVRHESPQSRKRRNPSGQLYASKGPADPH